MESNRFVSYPCTLLLKPVPGQREIRFRPAKNTMNKRPREERSHV